MKELKETKTYANLLAAFAGEAQARSKYLLYAEKAEKDGYAQMAALFRETAQEEKEHAGLLYALLSGETAPSSPEHLLDTAGTAYEWRGMYADFAKEAKEEGFEEIAKLFGALEKNQGNE